MTLREKFNNALDLDDDKYITYECVNITDEFAIEFAEWLNVNTYKYPTKTTTKELLEIYKKEKKL